MSRRPVGAAHVASVVLAIGLVSLTGCYRITPIRVLDLSDAPDPSGVLRLSGELDVFTTSANHFRVQREIFDINDNLESRSEALPVNAPWMTGDRIWAPEIVHVGTQWMLYFAALTAPDSPYGNHRCIGVAYAPDPDATFVAQPEPVVCSGAPEEFIDPSVFTDTDGSQWLLYRHGVGDNISQVESVQIDPATGATVGPAAVLVGLADASPAAMSPGGNRIENPQLVQSDDGSRYDLLVSAGNWADSSYKTLDFACTGPTACSRRAVPSGSGPYAVVLMSSRAIIGPGGLSAVIDEGAPPTVHPYALFASIEPGTHPIRRVLSLATLQLLP
jgi:hypothetical protein